MELKRLLDRANVLLLQGAYQGAESFIEQAMAEADKLKSELAELDTLRTRVTEMASEVERLQSVIDEANAQEPNCWRISHRSFCGTTTDSKEIAEDSFYSGHVTPLYARPIPAQQSPALAAPDLKQEYKLFCKWCDENQRLNLDPRLHTHSGQVESGGYIDQKMANVAFKAWRARNGNPSPRITEQDAREIVTDWNSYISDDNFIPDFEWNAPDWKKRLRALLNKLNGDHNGK